MLEDMTYLNLVFNAFLICIVLLLNRSVLHKIKRILDIFDTGGWRDCPFKPAEGKKFEENPHEGGE